MIAIVVGPDDALVRDAVREILRRQDPNDESTTRLDGRTVKPNDVLMAASSIGFFGSGRVVLVEDFLARFAKAPAKTAKSAKSANVPDWDALFSAIPAENTLLLVDQTLASVPAAVKKALPKDAEIRFGEPPRGRELLQWMVATAREEQARLGEREARLLADRLYPQSWSQKANNPAYDRPPDLAMIRQEIARLALSAHPDPISAAIIERDVARGDDDKIFRFLDAASSGNLAIALPELDHLLVAGEDPGRLLSQLAQNIELGIVMASAGGRAPADVGKEIGLANANRMTAIARGVQGVPPARLRGALRAVTAADRRIKRGELRGQLDGLYEALTAIAALRA